MSLFQRPILHRLGSFRHVFLVGAYAVKVPRADKVKYGRWCNTEESRLFAGTRHPLLCPVVAADAYGFWLIMRRADDVPVGTNIKPRRRWIGFGAK